MLIVSLDIGTSSTRASLYTLADGAPVEDAVQAIAHEPEATAEGGSTLDAEALVQEVITCLKAVLAKVPGEAIVGVAVSTFWHSTVGVDAQGRAVTPILLWSDTRARAQVARLQQEQDGAAYTQRTGCPLHTSFLPGRLLYLAETEPEIFTRCMRFLSPGEYLFARLFGLERVTCSFSMASATGLFDQHRQEWDEAVLSWVSGLTAERFSPVGDALVQGLLPEWRAELPELAEVPFAPALGDGACSNIGCGATSPDRLALMIGTSGAMRVVVPGETVPAVPPGLWRYQVGQKMFLLGGALSNGGAVWSWLKDTMQMPTTDTGLLQREIEALPPDGHGLTVLPFLAGERAPLWRDDLRAAMHGMSLATTTMEIVRAHLEAVAFRFVMLREALLPVTPQAEIIGTGAGLLSSRVWAQIITDALGVPVHLSEERQASSRGAALVLRERLGGGHFGETKEAAIAATLSPRPEFTTVYARARARQERLLQLLLDFRSD